MDLQPIIESAREQVRAVREQSGMPGLAVALVKREGPVWSECFGAVDTGAGSRTIDPHTIFSLQSTSKTFTATAVMLAVQQRLLDLDAPITRYLPGFAVKSRHERDPQRRITLRHLLSHRAGLTHEAPLGGNFDPELESAAPDFEAHVASISGAWLRYPVGQRFAYSNLGIDLAGAALMEVCRAPFAECLRQLIFEPLGMADSTSDSAVYSARENRAIGHQPSGAPVAVRIPIEASGGVYSSLADMTRYARFHLGRGTYEGRTTLSPALWDEMHTPAFDGYPYALGIVRQALPLERACPTLFNHDGSGYGFGSCFTYCPENDLAWIVLFNGQTRMGLPLPFDHIALHDALKAEFGPSPPVSAPAEPTITPPRETLAPFAGAYVAGLASMTVGWEDGRFGFRLPGDEAPNPLAFTGPGRAFVAEGPMAGRRVTLHPPSGLQPAWLEFFPSGGVFDLNTGEDEPPGSIGEVYDAWLGDYRIVQWGATVMTVSLSKQDGRLCLAHLRLEEHAPGLLFSADGEVLDLTGDTPSFRNIPLQRVAPG